MLVQSGSGSFFVLLAVVFFLYWEKELREAIRRIRTAVPKASILVMSQWTVDIAASRRKSRRCPPFRALWPCSGVSRRRRGAAGRDTAILFGDGAGACVVRGDHGFLRIA